MIVGLSWLASAIASTDCGNNAGDILLACEQAGDHDSHKRLVVDVVAPSGGPPRQRRDSC
jgi:hypothetical protein